MDITVLFLTDSSRLGHHKHPERFYSSPECYSAVRGAESWNFCYANNLNPKTLFFLYGDGCLGEEGKLLKDIVHEHVKSSNLVLVPALGEHKDHDAANKTVKHRLGRFQYTVAPKDGSNLIEFENQIDNEKYFTFVDKFYFWYPSQRDNFMPSIYSGYLKDVV